MGGPAAIRAGAGARAMLTGSTGCGDPRAPVIHFPATTMARGGFYSVDSLRGVHVLVVHHEADCRDLLTAVLNYCGALVTAVDSPEAALSVMALIKPDVLVVDLARRDKDGHWLIRQVRSLKPEDGGVVPVVALSPSQGAAGLEGAAAAGFVACLGKPLDPWQLCRVVSGVTNSA
jgi:CheY-like chemotaxis protein